MPNKLLFRNVHYLGGAVGPYDEYLVELSQDNRSSILVGWLDGGADKMVLAVKIDLDIAPCNLLGIDGREGRDFRQAREFTCVLVVDMLNVVDSELHQVVEVVLIFCNCLVQVDDVLLVFGNIKRGDAAYGDLEEALDVAVLDVSVDELAVFLQSFARLCEDFLDSLAGFDALVDAFFYENLRESFLQYLLLQLGNGQFQLRLQVFLELRHIPSKDIGDSHLDWLVVLDDQHVGVESLLAISVCVELLDGLLRVDVALEVDFNADVFGGVVVDGGKLHLAALGGGLDGGEQGVGRRRGRHLANDKLLVPIRLDACTDADASRTVGVVGGVH